MPIRKNFPSLNALVVLESAVRLRSFTAAATELGVTQAAVSRQVAALEEELGAALFVRKHRAIEPTAKCLILASSLARSFSTIAESVDLFRTDDQQQVVTIGATLGVSALWMLPRLGEFRAKFPEVQIKLVSQDSRINLDNNEVDVLVRFGNPPFDDGQTLATRSDEVFPVCSPDYLARLQAQGKSFPDEVDLIAHAIPERSWFTWSDWFVRAGINARQSTPHLLFSHYTEVLEAARAGHGVALGWRVLVDAYMKSGSLVRLGDVAVQAEGRYNLMVPWKQKPNPMRQVLIDWLADSLSQR